jgi:integrase
VTVQLRGNTWSARVRLIDEATGHTRLTRITLGHPPAVRTRAQAETALQNYLAATDPQRRRPGRQVLMGTECKRYLARQVPLMRPASQKQLTHLITAYLLPHLGHRQLLTITAEVLQAMILKEHQRGLARSTLENIRSCALMVLTQAALEGKNVPRITRKAVRLPKESKARREPSGATVAEFDALLTHAADDRCRALYGLMGLAGLRIAEALGVTRQDVDIAGRLLHVRQSVVLGHVQALKTDTSRQDLPLTPALVSLLRVHLTSPDIEPHASGLLFTDTDRRPLKADAVRVQWLHRDLKEAGIPQHGFHWLRHGLPRRLFAAGVSAPVVQRLMRHSSLEMTQRYTHTDAEDLRAAVNRHGAA